MSSHPMAAVGAVPISGSASCRQIAAQPAVSDSADLAGAASDDPASERPEVGNPVLNDTARPPQDG